MKKYRLEELSAKEGEHFLAGVLPGKKLKQGGLSFKKPGERSHSNDGPDGSDRHVHDDCEAFVVLQGKAVMELDGKEYPLVTGDVMVVEPGEDHHLVADEEAPCVHIWLHS
jgi:mannose-6-phosphate isomerase-like protein (cupin superfamily)